MPAKRLFIAIDISDEARRTAADHIDKIRAFADGVRVGWERPDKLHITLMFLGNVDEHLIPSVNDAVAAVAARNGSFSASLAGTGVFPNARKSRVLWLGLNDDGSLRHIATELDDKLQTLGFESEDRTFSPHLTIARIREPQRAKRLAGKHLQSRFEPVEFTVSELVVYESLLKSTGSVYRAVSRHPISSPDISRSPR